MKFDLILGGMNRSGLCVRVLEWTSEMLSLV